jgi:hypothetical protein
MTKTFAPDLGKKTIPVVPVVVGCVLCDPLFGYKGHDEPQRTRRWF